MLAKRVIIVLGLSLTVMVGLNFGFVLDKVEAVSNILATPTSSTDTIDNEDLTSGQDTDTKFSFVIETYEEVNTGVVGIIATSSQDISALSHLQLFIYSTDNKYLTDFEILIKQAPLRWQGEFDTSLLANGTYQFSVGIFNSLGQPQILSNSITKQVYNISVMTPDIDTYDYKFRVETGASSLLNTGYVTFIGITGSQNITGHLYVKFQPLKFDSASFEDEQHTTDNFTIFKVDHVAGKPWLYRGDLENSLPPGQYAISLVNVPSDSSYGQTAILPKSTNLKQVSEVKTMDVVVTDYYVSRKSSGQVRGGVLKVLPAGLETSAHRLPTMPLGDIDITFLTTVPDDKNLWLYIRPDPSPDDLQKGFERRGRLVSLKKGAGTIIDNTIALGAPLTVWKATVNKADLFSGASTFMVIDRFGSTTIGPQEVKDSTVIPFYPNESVRVLYPGHYINLVGFANSEGGSTNTDPNNTYQPPAPNVPVNRVNQPSTEQPENTSSSTAESLTNNQATKFISVSRECVEYGVGENEALCQKLMSLSLDAECREAGLYTQADCQEFQKKLYFQTACEQQNLINPLECEDFFLAQYQKQIDCNGRTELECKELIRDNFFGSFLSTFSKDINKVIIPLREQQTNVGSLSEVINNAGFEEAVFPLSTATEAERNQKIYLTPAIQKTLIADDENIYQAPPAVIMIDSDADGLIDDLERKFGTDVNNPDSDGDGYKDGEEIKNGYDPLGPGKFTKDLAPLDKAILANQPLEQPIVSGAINQDLTIEKVENFPNGEGLKISGKVQPLETVAVFIYSTMPLVLTTQADEQGNWTYYLDKPLTNDKHEAYVTVTDETGKISGKSQALTFFVKEARAVSVEDYLIDELPSNFVGQSVDNKLWYFVIGGLGLIFVAVIVFVLFHLRRNHGGGTEAT